MDNEWKLLKDFNPGEIVSNEEETIICYILSQSNEQTVYKFIKHDDISSQFTQMEYPHHRQTIRWKLFDINKIIEEKNEIIKNIEIQLNVLNEIKKATQPKLIVGEMYQLNRRRKYALVFYSPVLIRFVSVEIDTHTITEKRYNIISMNKLMDEGNIVHMASDADKVKAKAIMTLVENESHSA